MSDEHVVDERAIREYEEAQKAADLLRMRIPTDRLLTLSYNGFLLAEQEITDVVDRLGNRKRDLDELLSIAKTIQELAKKCKRMHQRLAHEMVDEVSG